VLARLESARHHGTVSQDADPHAIDLKHGWPARGGDVRAGANHGDARRIQVFQRVGQALPVLNNEMAIPNLL
jgi:hypothetical protein